MTPQERIIQRWKSWLNYCEKATNAWLEELTKNAGHNNYNRFSNWLVKNVGSPFGHPEPWCDDFMDCNFAEEFGKDVAKEMIGGWSAYTPQSANFYKAMGRWSTSPHIADQIFFKTGSGICHTGGVIGFDDNYVYTIEGNTSSKAGLVDNGGCVAAKAYPRNSSYIAGYGTPNWNLAKLEDKVFKPSNVVTRKNAVIFLYRLFGSPKVTVPEQSPWSDIVKTEKAEDYFYPMAIWAWQTGAVSGTSEGKFDPSGPCTRAQFLQMMWKLSGSVVEKPKKTFSDVKKDDWFYNAVSWASNHGIAAGVSKDEFKPNSKINRGQAVTFLYAAQGKPAVNGDMPFVDVSEKNYYYNPVLWAYKKGITTGA